MIESDNDVKVGKILRSELSPDLCCFVSAYIVDLQENIRFLKERIAYLERSNNRQEDTINGLRNDVLDSEFENIKYKNIIEELRKDLKQQIDIPLNKDFKFFSKMILNELEQLEKELK